MKLWKLALLLIVCLSAVGCATKREGLSFSDEATASVASLGKLSNGVKELNKKLREEHLQHEARLFVRIDKVLECSSDNACFEAKSSYLAERDVGLRNRLSTHQAIVHNLQNVLFVLGQIEDDQKKGAFSVFGNNEITEENLKVVSEFLSGSSALAEMLEKHDALDGNAADNIKASLMAFSSMFEKASGKESFQFGRWRDEIAEVLSDARDFNTVLKHELASIASKKAVLEAKHQDGQRQEARQAAVERYSSLRQGR